MKVKCVRTKVTPECRPGFSLNVDYHVTEQRFYTVLGLTFTKNAQFLGPGVLVEIVTDYGHLASCPMELFEVAESSISRFWKIREMENGDILLWPLEFFQPYFHDDLSEDVPEVVKTFRRVRDAIEQEISLAGD